MSTAALMTDRTRTRQSLASTGNDDWAPWNPDLGICLPVEEDLKPLQISEWNRGMYQSRYAN